MLTMLIAKVLTSEVFWIFGTTIIATAIGVLLKVRSRGGNQRSKKNVNEWNVGAELIISAMIITMTKSTDPSERINGLVFREAMGLVLLFVFFLLAVSVFVNQYGWKNKNELYLWSGIVAPDFLGLTSLFLVYRELF